MPKSKSTRPAPDPSSVRKLGLDAAAGILIFLLLREWIEPIAEMSGLDRPGLVIPIYWALGAFLIVDVLRIPPWAGASIKLPIAVYAVGWLTGAGRGYALPSLSWFVDYYGIMVGDMGNAAAGEWEQVSSETRTLMFLAGWGILAGVIYSLCTYTGRCFWLVGVTFLYLLGLQLWPGLDTTAGLAVSAGAGLLLMAVLNLGRLKEDCSPGLLTDGGAAIIPAQGGSGTAKAYARESREGWGWAGASVVTVAVLIALAAFGAGNPEERVKPLDEAAVYRLAEAMGMHPPESFTERELAPALRTAALQMAGITGYGADDSFLGGPISKDESVAFTAQTSFLTYWRGESKSTYDGRGWTEPRVRVAPAEDAFGAGEAASSRNVVQELLFPGGSRPEVLFAGGRLVGLEALLSAEGKILPEAAVVYRPDTGRIGLREDWGTLNYAKLSVAVLDWREEELRTTGSDYSPFVKEVYLQLPDRLPGRVRALAAEITKQAVTPYDKAASIQAHLKTHYSYSLTEARVPANGQDFVDAFLFGNGVGYCDYFSTSMVVLLRSVGVPARWVKGFAPGEAGASDGSGMVSVTVRNKDAHSWVEVYFPGAGWIPFDPTPGFGGVSPEGRVLSPEEAVTLAGGQAGEGGLPRKAEPAAAAKNGPEAGSTKAADFSRELGDAVRRMTEGTADAAWSAYSSLPSPRLFWAAAVLLLLPLLYAAWKYRQDAALWLLLRFRPAGRGRKPKLLMKLLDGMWLRVYRRHGRKPPDMTLREYVASVSQREPEAAEPLKELALLYESIRYDAEGPSWLPRRKLTDLWQKLFHRRPEDRQVSS